MIVIALVTAIGGGTLRDLLLGREPVFWVLDPTYIVVIVTAGLGTVVLTRQSLMPERALQVADALGLAGTPVNLVGFLLYLLAGAARWITPSHSSVREPTFLRMMRRQMFLVTWCFGTGQGDGDVTSVYFDRMEELHAFRCCAPPPGALLRTRPNPTMEQDGRWWVPYVED